MAKCNAFSEKTLRVQSGKRCNYSACPRHRMNSTPDTPGNPLKRVVDGISNLLQQVFAISAADFNRWLKSVSESVGRRLWPAHHSSFTQLISDL